MRDPSSSISGGARRERHLWRDTREGCVGLQGLAWRVLPALMSAERMKRILGAEAAVLRHRAGVPEDPSSPRSSRHSSCTRATPQHPRPRSHNPWENSRKSVCLALQDGMLSVRLRDRASQ